MNYQKELLVESWQAQDLQNMLEETDSSIKGDGTEFDEEVVFENGVRMAIQICASGDPAEEPCWTQGVLFSPEGHELGFTEPDDSFLGEYTIDYKGDEYTVVVKIKPE